MTQQANVDADEINKFSALASQWWDKNGEFKALHDINPLRLDFIRQHAHGLAGKRIIDVGCGGGILSEALAAEAQSVCGIDMAEASLQTAREHAAAQHIANLEYRCISVEDMAAQHAGEFDIVVCMEMLEHVPDPQSIIRACAKLVKADGCVFFSTLNRNGKSYLQAIVAAEYLLGLVAKGTHSCQKFITPAELARMCRQAQLDWHESTGMSYNPLTQRYFLQDSLDVNYMMVCRPIA